MAPECGTPYLMKNIALFIFTSLVVLAAPFGAVARADRVDFATREWVETVRKASRAGELSFETVDPVSNVVTNSTRARLLEISLEQAQIWADTILGGDYLADEEVIVDSIEFVRLGDQLLGYRVTYSSSAYDTLDCNPEGDLSLCVSGRIVESSFVAPGLDSWIRDDQRYAEFVATQNSL